MLTKITNSPKIIPDEAALTLLFNTISSFSLRDRLLQLETEAEYKEVIEFFGGRRVATREEFYTTEASYDICASCLSVIGETVGGRVRCGCYNCTECKDETRLNVIFFTTFSGLSSEEATFYLSRILFKMKEEKRNEI